MSRYSYSRNTHDHPISLLEVNIDLASQKQAAFTLIEVAFTLALAAGTIVSLYTAFGFGFALIRNDRDDLRATQILLEKAETLRLYNWDQITKSNVLPANFISYTDVETNTSGNTMVYRGTTVVTNAPMNNAYSNEVRMVTFRLVWGLAGSERTRSLSTFVARYGLQPYVY